MPRRQRKDARFCRPSCRAAWHQAQRTAALDELATIIARATVLVIELKR